MEKSTVGKETLIPVQGSCYTKVSQPRSGRLMALVPSLCGVVHVFRSLGSNPIPSGYPGEMHRYEE